MVDSLYYMGLIARDEGDKEKAADYFTRARQCNISALNTVNIDEINAELELLKKS